MCCNFVGNSDVEISKAKKLYNTRGHGNAAASPRG